MRIRSLMTAAALALALALASPVYGQAAPTYPSSPPITVTKALTPAGITLTWSWSAPATNTDGSAIAGTLAYEVFQGVGPAGAALAPLLVTQNLSAAEQITKTGTYCAYVIAVEGGTFTAATSSAPATIVGGLSSVPSNMACGAVEAPPQSPPGFTGG